MFTKYFTCNTKQKTVRETSQNNESVRKELAAWKMEIIWNNCFLQRYATDITDILNKTISQEVS